MENQLTENALQLVVSEKTLGTLVTNASVVRDNVRNSLVRYENTIYDDSNIEVAKGDKALLNKAAKVLNSERIAIEKEFMQPFQEFKTIVTDTVQLISQCSSKIDTVVKIYEEKEREDKRKEIESYFNSLSFKLVSLQKIFDQRWLNKTVKFKQITTEIDAKVAQIYEDIETLKTLGEDVDLLVSVYLNHLSVSAAIQYANQLKQNRERAKVEEENRLQRELDLKNQKEEEAKRAAMRPKAIDPTPVIPEAETKEPLLTRVVRIVATKEQFISLTDYLLENNISFTKIGME